MGHELDPSTGKPTFNNTPSTVSDLQAAADFTEQIGVLWVDTVADLELIEYPREGELRRVRASGDYYAYDGTGWAILSMGPFAEVTADATVTSATGSGSSAPFYWSGSQTVAFPVDAGFTVAPKVTGSPSGNSAGSIFPGAQFSDITTAGFTFRVFRIDSAPAIGTKITYRAVQQTATTA